MTRWVDVQVPTDYYDCKDYYIKEENVIFIVTWIPEHPDAVGEIVATLKIDSKPSIHYHEPSAAYDGLVQANVTRVLKELEEGTYNFNKNC